jgi:hypothetical protein
VFGWCLLAGLKKTRKMGGFGKKGPYRRGGLFIPLPCLALPCFYLSTSYFYFLDGRRGGSAFSFWLIAGEGFLGSRWEGFFSIYSHDFYGRLASVVYEMKRSLSLYFVLFLILSTGMGLEKKRVSFGGFYALDSSSSSSSSSSSFCCPLGNILLHATLHILVLMSVQSSIFSEERLCSVTAWFWGLGGDGAVLCEYGWYGSFQVFTTYSTRRDQVEKK